MARMETDHSKQTHIRWKIKWRLEHLGALGIMGLSRRPRALQSLPAFTMTLAFHVHSVEVLFPECF